MKFFLKTFSVTATKSGLFNHIVSYQSGLASNWCDSPLKNDAIAEHMQHVMRQEPCSRRCMLVHVVHHTLFL
jgi:hypothetical protein